MSCVVITGAAGFVGRALVQACLEDPETAVIAVDQPSCRPNVECSDSRIQWIFSSFSGPELLQEIATQRPSIIYHLASVPGSLAERDFELGVQTNLFDTLNFFHHVARCYTNQPPRVVFASSIAVYGLLDHHTQAGDQTVPRPQLSYGVHKLMTEQFLADMSRRKQLDAVALRLPGIVARPPSPSGHGSAFMSDVFHHAMNGQPYICPVSLQARAWWMSVTCAVNNLLHAGTLPTAMMPFNRTIQVPVLVATMAQICQALEKQYPEFQERISFQPHAETERHFGRYPLLQTPTAERLGFRHDGNLQTLIRAISRTVAQGS